MIEEAIFSLVTGNTAIKALIGLRLYPGVIPQDATLPAIGFQMLPSEKSHTHDGKSSLSRESFGFTIDARKFEEAKPVVEALDKLLDGYKGDVGKIRFTSIFQTNEYDGYFSVSSIFIQRRDYLISWKEI